MLNPVKHSTSGLTLIEVVAALVLMGGLLAGTMAVFSRIKQQTRMLHHKQQAVKLVDQLFWEWVTTGQFQQGHIPRQGFFKQAPGYYWQITTQETVISDSNTGFQLQKCHLELNYKNLQSNRVTEKVIELEFVLPPAKTSSSNQITGVQP